MALISQQVNARTWIPRRFSIVGVSRLFLLIAISAPIFVVARSVFGFENELWSLLWRTTLVRQILTTICLGVSVSLTATLSGAALGWLLTAYSFPGSAVFRRVLMLPFAIPAYVFAFLALGIFDFTGPVQTAWRSAFGQDAWFPNVRSPITAWLVLSIALMPYAYIASMAAYAERGAAPSAAARTLGLGPMATWWRVVLPMARPQLGAAGALILMETVTDVGVARTLGVQTLADGMLRAWFGLDQREGAAELAVLLACTAFGLIGIERLTRRGSFRERRIRSIPIPALPLKGRAKWVATGVCLFVSSLSFFVPVVTLAVWSIRATRRGGEGAFDSRFWSLAQTSITLAGLVGAVCVAVVCALSLGKSSSQQGTSGVTDRLGWLGSLGYAMPGLVVAVGTLQVLSSIDGLFDRLATWNERLYVPFLFAGSLAGVVYGLSIRFLGVGRENVKAGIDRLNPRMLQAARSLGAGSARLVFRIQLPLLRGSLIVAALLVALDTLKELPATLLLRPPGRDTLAVFVWNMTNESRWEEAASPALAIVAVGVPLVWAAERLLLGAPSRARD